MDHYFRIEGCRETGTYFVYEITNGIAKEISEPVVGMRTGGLKKARQTIGQYLLKNGHSLSSSFTHYCIKPGRKKNYVHNWTVEQYLVGVPMVNSID
ncbi:hypothetical protein [Brevibacillus fulvus]|uniref:Uncharacterized protein n=1 Tax=Brevibacillus fulvus TaxID=1125967 RepID=A0A939BRL2_9BACL|nr:hypothetical protein [Brevibacillus fulvus]MBM7589578.1 hypothetical protein [Brevibacillus fulvus]